MRINNASFCGGLLGAILKKMYPMLWRILFVTWRTPLTKFHQPDTKISPSNFEPLVLRCIKTMYTVHLLSFYVTLSEIDPIRSRYPGIVTVLGSEKKDGLVVHWGKMRSILLKEMSIMGTIFISKTRCGRMFLWSSREIRFYLHKEFRAAEIGF